MAEAIKLYYDKVSPNGEHAQTQNGEKILYNLKQISEDFFAQYTDMLTRENMATIFLPTGKYISIITASLDVNGKFMVTMDLHDSEPFAKYQADQSEGNSEVFMKVFYQIRNNSTDHDKFILVEGQIPAQQDPET